MVYIDLVNSEKELINYLEKANGSKLIYLFNKFTNRISKISINGRTVLLLYRLNERTLKKLGKIFNQINSKTVCLSQNLEENKVLINYLNENGNSILNGRWLFSCLVDKILEYIENEQQEDMQEKEIAILTNDLNEIQAEWIFRIATKYKRLSLITKEAEKFKKIEEHLFDEFGIQLNTTSNERKGLKNADIILNFNFSEYSLNRFNINRKAIIVNFEREVFIQNKGFNGIVVNNYKIDFPRKYFEYEKLINNFSENVLYESIIYKKTNIKNIIKQIENDDINIKRLIGIRGEIKKQEYSKIKSSKTIDKI